jgi:HPt (histidine-containing phosphotransfer) domain-containing protein
MVSGSLDSQNTVNSLNRSIVKDLRRLREAEIDPLRAIVEMFLHETSAQFAELNKSLAEGDLRRSIHLAHALERGAKSIGAELMAEMLRDLEQRFISRKEQRGALVLAVAPAYSEFKHVADMLKNEIDRPDRDTDFISAPPTHN